uniref:Uncharacterized protein n=2 Tax=Peronospora matthiolae TaxID=2874970 RepID=A0AAV1TEH6_9STRA
MWSNINPNAMLLALTYSSEARVSVKVGDVSRFTTYQTDFVRNTPRM